MSRDNVLWGAPRIHSELLKLGFQSLKRRWPNTWCDIPSRHRKRGERFWQITCRKWFRSTSSPYTPSGSRLMFVFVVLAHDRRRILHFNVTVHPTAEWTAQQIVEAFPFDSAPKYLLRDRDRIYGYEFRKQLKAWTSTKSSAHHDLPGNGPYVERLIGSIRRECLDHVIVFNEECLRRTLLSYIRYYHGARLHLSLEKDSPDPRSVQPVGEIVAIPQVGGPAPSLRTTRRLKPIETRRRHSHSQKWQG